MNVFKDNIITISGLPGSGTSTAARLLSKRTGMKVISTGEIFREMARESGFSLEEFGEVAESNKEIDTKLDKRVVEKASPGCIMEGRLTGHMLERSGKDAYKIWLEADVDVRVERIAEREKRSVEDVRGMVEVREKSERKRYKDYYGIDLLDTSIYDEVIDSEENTPEEIVAKIMEGLKDEVYEGEE